MPLTNLKSNRLLIFLRDAARRPINVIGLAIVRLWLAARGWPAAARRALGQAAPAPGGPPPICESFEVWQRRPEAKRAVYLLNYPASSVAQPAPGTVPNVG